MDHYNFMGVDPAKPGSERTVIIHIPVFDPQNPTNPGSYVNRYAVKGMPLYWRDEVSGRLPAAVWAFLDRTANEDQLQLVIAYIQHHIHAPCWLNELDDEEMANEIKALRQLSLTLKTFEDVHQYIHRALDIGLDPL